MSGIHYPERFRLVAVLLISLAALSMQSTAQENAENNAPRQLSGTQIRDLLREPNGLQQLAALQGKFVVNGSLLLWARVSLATLVKGSDLIVVGTVSNRESFLSSDGDSILTTYTIQVGQTLKGPALTTVKITARGGVVSFPNNTSAEVETILEKELKVGQQFTWFLLRSESSQYRLANDEESVISTPAAGGLVEPLSAHDWNPLHPINKDVRSMQTQDLVNKSRDCCSLLGGQANTTEAAVHAARPLDCVKDRIVV